MTVEKEHAVRIVQPGAPAPGGRCLQAARALVGALAALLVMAVSGQAQDILNLQLQQGFGKNKVRYKEFDWHVMESEHVQVLFEPEFGDLADDAIAHLERVYSHVAGIFHHELSYKPPIVIYQSNYEFQQTNIVQELLPPGVAGFAEPLRYRVVVPFSGDLDDFHSTLTHELAHIFQYDILYKGPVKRISNPLTSPPTWIMEGLAEYTTPGRNTIDEMVLRDAVLTGNLISLEEMDGAWGSGNVFLAYKEAHSLMEYIAQNYGPEKVSRLLRVWDAQNDTDKLLERLVGMDRETLFERWSSQQRKHYCPLLQTRDYPTDIGRAVVKDADDRDEYLSDPRWSLSGDMLVVSSSDGVEQHVDIVRVEDGSLVERVTQGMRAWEYDYLASGGGTVSWAPDGRTIAFVAKDGPRDEIVTWDLYSKEVQQTLSFASIELIEALAWAPDSRRLAFVGTGYGQSDIYIVDARGGQLQQLTGTPQRDDFPAFSPDGSQLAFSSKVGHQFDIRIMDLETGEVRGAIETPADDMWPQWLPEGNKLLFVSTREKISDLFVYHLGEKREYRLTRTLTGVLSPALSPDGRRIVYSAYYQGRPQLYVLDMPDWSEVPRRDKELAARAQGAPVVADTVAAAPGSSSVPPEPPVSRPPGPTSLRSTPRVPENAELLADASGRGDAVEMTQQGRLSPAQADTLRRPEPVAADTADTATAGMPDSLSHRRYTPNLEFDGVSVQMGYFDGFLSSIAELSMSDLLGNHSLSLATDYVASQEISNDFNFALSYSYYGQRPTYDVSVFNWNQYFNSNDIYQDQQGRLYRGIARSQQRGMLANVSYPIDLYRRLDMSYTYVNERQDVVWPQEAAGGSLSTHLLKAAYVHDSITYGLLGPTVGRRYFISVGRTLDLSESHRSFSHVEVDYRHYIRLGQWSVLGLRGVGVGSLGANALQYNLGGPAWFLPFYTGFDLNVGPLRGYGYSEFIGSRVVLANTELRVPFVRQIVFGWPTTFAVPAVDGSLFLDIGTAWNEGDKLDLWPLHDPHAGLESGQSKRLRAGFG
ncbi:MAG: peptidase MA family metallohydrolase, partial [Candidatus Latescibacterota bacterium]